MLLKLKLIYSYLHRAMLLIWLGSVQPVEATTTVLSSANNSVAVPGTPTTPGGSKLSPGNIFKNFFKWVLNAWPGKILLKRVILHILWYFIYTILSYWQWHGKLLCSVIVYFSCIYLSSNITCPNNHCLVFASKNNISSPKTLLLKYTI